MKSNLNHFTAEDGVKIFYYKWEPKKTGKLKGAVQIAHGMAEHASRYADFAQALNDEGYVVYANDHRGHGKTAGHVDNVGYFADVNGWKIVVDDMHHLTQIIRRENPKTKVFLFGHSMGSFLSRNYIMLYHETLNGAVISGTCGDPGLLGKIGLMVAKREVKKKGQKFRSELLTKLSFGNYNKSFMPNRTDYDWLSSDPVEVDKYIADPFCGGVFTAQYFVDVLGGISTINNPRLIAGVDKNLPIYLFSGEKDPVGNNGKGVTSSYKAYLKAGIKDVSIKLYKNGRHEMLNEVNKKEVYRDVIDWLNKHS